MVNAALLCTRAVLGLAMAARASALARIGPVAKIVLIGEAPYYCFVEGAWNETPAPPTGARDDSSAGFVLLG